VPTPKINLLINIVLLIKLHFKRYPCLKYIHVYALDLKKPPSGKKKVLLILENGEITHGKPYYIKVQLFARLNKNNNNPLLKESLKLCKNIDTENVLLVLLYKRH
jgi:hypothetical protein